MDPKLITSKSASAEPEKGKTVDNGANRKKRRRRAKIKPNLVPRKIPATEALAANVAAGSNEPGPSKAVAGPSPNSSSKTEVKQLQGEIHESDYDSSYSFESEGTEPRYEGEGNQFRELATDTEEEAQKLEAFIQELKARRQHQTAPKAQRQPHEGEKQQRDETRKPQQTQQAQVKGRQRVPPIYIFKERSEETVKLCKLAIKDRFYVKRYSNNKHAVICRNIDDYKKVKSVLERAQSQFYTFTVKNEKIQTVLLKGVDPGVEPEELLAGLKDHENEDLRFVSVKRFSTTASRSNQRQLPIFLVQLSPTSKLEGLRSIKYLNYHVISWDRLNKKDGVLQCMRCQRFGHAASNCNMAYRCVKCDQDHKPGECSLGKERVDDRSKLFCVLCRKNGHPANYRGCPKYEELRKKIRARKQQLEEEKRQKSRMFQNFVTPNMSFAQMASGLGQVSRQQPQKVPTAPSAADIDLKAVLLSIQGQIAQLQK